VGILCSGLTKSHVSRRTLLSQKQKHAFIDHRRLTERQIVTGARNDPGRNPRGHSLQAAHGLLGRVDDLVFTDQE
jgi:hypothetical protein